MQSRPLRDIRHLPDVCVDLAREGAGIRIELRIDEVDPPEGHARAEDGSSRAFTGWLGLLEAVSALVEDGTPDAPDAPGTPAGR